MNNIKPTKLFSGLTVCSSKTVVGLKVMKYGDNSIDVTVAHDDDSHKHTKLFFRREVHSSI